MTRRTIVCGGVLLVTSAWLFFGDVTNAQQPPAPPSAQNPASGRGGPPVQGAEEDIPLVARFDRNGDKVLDHEERVAAREYLTAHPELRRPVRGGRINR